MENTDALVAMVLRELDEITVSDRVRQATDLRVQDRMDAEMLGRIGTFMDASDHVLAWRLSELEHEWDIERVLMAQSSLTSMAGVMLGALGKRRGLLLSLVTSGFLLQHATQGWCPPLALHRRLGFRSRAEIDLEIHMLKLLRGDFAAVAAGADADEPQKRSP